MLSLTNARVFDGSDMLPGRYTVSLDGNRIAGLSDRPNAAAPGEQIDLGGMTVMPGMVTCHLHPDTYKWTLQDHLSANRLGKERPPGVMMAGPWMNIRFPSLKHQCPSIASASAGPVAPAYARQQSATPAPRPPSGTRHTTRRARGPGRPPARPGRRRGTRRSLKALRRRRRS